MLEIIPRARMAPRAKFYSVCREENARVQPAGLSSEPRSIPDARYFCQAHRATTAILLIPCPPAAQRYAAPQIIFDAGRRYADLLLADADARRTLPDAHVADAASAYEREKSVRAAHLRQICYEASRLITTIGEICC